MTRKWWDWVHSNTGCSLWKLSEVNGCSLKMMHLDPILVKPKCIRERVYIFKLKVKNDQFLSNSYFFWGFQLVYSTIQFSNWTPCSTTSQDSRWCMRCDKLMMRGLRIEGLPQSENFRILQPNLREINFAHFRVSKTAILKVK